MNETEGSVTIFVAVLMGRLERFAEVELNLVSGTALGKSGQQPVASTTCIIIFMNLVDL